MKKIWFITILLSSLLVFTACSNSNEIEETTEGTIITEDTTAFQSTEDTEISASSSSSAEETDATEESEFDSDAPISLETDSGILLYTGHELVEDVDGNPAILIYFDYTNKDTETAHTAISLFNVNVFQNDNANASADLSFNPDQLETARREIDPGVTVSVAFVSLLEDETSDIKIEISASDDSDEKTTRTLKLSD